MCKANHAAERRYARREITARGRALADGEQRRSRPSHYAFISSAAVEAGQAASQCRGAGLTRRAGPETLQGLIRNDFNETTPELINHWVY